MIVQDCNGRQITVGCSVLYGSPEPHDRDAHTAEVFAISEPDVVYNPVTDADDGGYGGYAVSIGIRFADGETETVRLIQRLAAKRDREQSNKGELMDHYVVITTDHDYNNHRIERMTLSPADEENAWVTAHQQFEKEASEDGEDRTVVAVIEERCVPGVLAALAAGGYGERL